MTRYTSVALAAIILGFASPLQAQSLAEAAEKAAAIKAARVAKGEWVPIVSAAGPTVPVVAAPVMRLPAGDVVTGSAALVKAEPAIDPPALAKNQAAGAALLTDRLVALRALQDTRDRNAAHYRDACAGKETSAGWLLRGALVTTPNAETPACRTIASDLATQRAAFVKGHLAIEEAARTAGIFPGVLRDLFASHGVPERD